MAVTVTDLSDFSYRIITNQDSDFSIAAIAYFYRNSLGLINNLLKASFTINPTTLEFSPELDDNTAEIFKLFFKIYYYDIKINSSLGAGALDSVLQIDDFGTSVRTVNRNEIAKTWLQLRKETKLQLDEQVQSYNYNSFSPVAVCGDDVVYSLNGGLGNTNVSDVIY